MASEINIQASVILQRSTIGLQAADTLPRDQTPGTKGLSTNVTVAANSDATGTLISVGFNIGYLYVKNLDTSPQASTKDVSLSLIALEQRLSQPRATGIRPAAIQRVLFDPTVQPESTTVLRSF